MMSEKVFFINDVLYQYIWDNDYDGLINHKKSCACDRNHCEQIFTCEDICCDCMPAFKDKNDCLKSYKPVEINKGK